MLAQRFDNGVYHLTVQDNAVQRVVAAAVGDPDKIQTAQKILGRMDPRDARAVNAIRALQSLETLLKSEPDFSRRFFTPDLQQALRAPAAAQERGRLAQALGLSDSSLLSSFSDIAFVAEPEKYIGFADIEIIPEPDNTLPDPSRKWVDMLYRIKPGRMDNEIGPRRKGEVEIWADGKKIVTVRGNLGATLKKDKPFELRGPYFKFGVYRKRVPGDVSMQLDEFSQAPTRAGLANICAAN